MNASDWWELGGHGRYVWGALAMCAAVLVAEVALLRLRRRLLERAVNDEIDDETTARTAGRNTLHGGRA